MYILSAIVIMSSLVAAMEKYMPLPNATLYQRQLMSCEQTYGAGAQNCGGESSRFCFKPNFGQTCCPDSGYCDKGFYCAPVTKYCCAEGEDLVTCARNAGFVLPASLACSTAEFANTSPSSVMSVAHFMSPTSTSIPPNFGVVTPSGVASVQALGDKTTTFPNSTGNNGFPVASVAANAGTFIVPSATAVSNDTTPPYVQVSATGKRGMMRFGTSAAVWVAVAWACLVGLRITA